MLFGICSFIVQNTYPGHSANRSISPQRRSYRTITTPPCRSWFSPFAGMEASFIFMPWCCTRSGATRHHNHRSQDLVKWAWERNLPTSKVQKVLPLPCLLLCSGAGFERTWNRVPEKKFSFRENFWPGKPSKTVISENQADLKMSTKPYAATLSEVFKT